MRISGFVIALVLTAGCASHAGPRQVTDAMGGEWAATNWSRVTELTAGTEILLALRGSAPVRRYVVSADDLELIVLDEHRIKETVARTDVVQITGPVAARGSIAGGILGGYLGFSAGVLPGLGGASPAVAYAAWAASIALGAYLGSHGSTHPTDGLIYRVP